MLHTKKFRAFVGEPRYKEVEKSVKLKIMAVTGLTSEHETLIDDVLWDSDPLVNYTDDRMDSVLNLISASRVFEKLTLYAKLPAYKKVKNRPDKSLPQSRRRNPSRDVKAEHVIS